MAIWQKNPNKMRIETTFEGKKIVRAYDGQKAWWIIPFISEEAQEMPQEQASILKEQADFKNPLVFYKDMGYKLELLGKEAMAGTAVFKLKLTKTDGKEVLFYLDAESGIELKSALATKNGESDSLKEIVFGDYKPVNGVMMPFHIENRINGKAQMQMTMDLVEINPVIDDAMFVMPLK
jgi:outer membrane lipoprotein-sorting protein